TAGATLAAVVVTIEDTFGNIQSSDASTVTLAKASGPGTIGGTLTAAAVSGVATFSTLSITTVGSYTLAGTDGSLASATSTGFSITPAAASQWIFTTEPGSTTAGATLAAVLVTIEDTFGNVQTSDTSTVTLAKASGPGTVGGTLAVGAVGGIATFSTLSITAVGSYTLAGTDGSLASATSTGFSITPAAASQLIFTTEPSSATAGTTLSAVVVTIEDTFGNVQTSDTST